MRGVGMCSVTFRVPGKGAESASGLASWRARELGIPTRGTPGRLDKIQPMSFSHFLVEKGSKLLRELWYITDVESHQNTPN